MKARDKGKIKIWHDRLKIKMGRKNEKCRKDEYINMIEENRRRDVKEWVKFNENSGRKNDSDKYIKSYDINKRISFEADIH
jgi:hypothetical protein